MRLGNVRFDRDEVRVRNPTNEIGISDVRSGERGGSETGDRRANELDGRNDQNERAEYQHGIMSRKSIDEIIVAPADAAVITEKTVDVESRKYGTRLERSNEREKTRLDTLPMVCSLEMFCHFNCSNRREQMSFRVRGSWRRNVLSLPVVHHPSTREQFSFSICLSSS